MLIVEMVIISVLAVIMVGIDSYERGYRNGFKECSDLMTRYPKVDEHA